MSDEIIKVLDALAEKFGIAVDWTEQNVLPYAQMLCEKFINYEIATSVCWLIIGAIIIIVSIVGWKYAKNYEYDDGFDAFLYIMSSFAFVIAFIVISYQVFDIVECLTFPEKMIFEYLRDIQS